MVGWKDGRGKPQPGAGAPPGGTGPSSTQTQSGKLVKIRLMINPMLNPNVIITGTAKEIIPRCFNPMIQKGI